MILRDGRPRASLSASNPSRSAAPPSSSEGQRRKTDDQERPDSTKPENAYRISGFRCQAARSSSFFARASRSSRASWCGLVARNRGDALHEVEDALGLATFLGQHSLDDLRRLGLEKPRLRRKSLRSSSLRATICSRAALMPLTKGIGRGIGEARQRRRGLMGEARGGVFASGGW